MRVFSQLFPLLLLTALVFSVMPQDSLRISEAEKLSVRYHYNLIIWEVANIPAKWLHWLGGIAIPVANQDNHPLPTATQFLKLQEQKNTLFRELDKVAAGLPGDSADLERRLAILTQQIDALRPQAEEVLETIVSNTLREQGIPLAMWGLVFPPVDFAIDRLPTLLVLSPRDRIERVESIWLMPDIPMDERDKLERDILEQEDLSALVTNIGGISTYPSIITSTSLRNILTVAIHEWLHQYLFFHPLGKNQATSIEMNILNETTANIVGDELGHLIYTELTGRDVSSMDDAPCTEAQFCFGREMRHTRLELDHLLGESKIEEAETYMELRRMVFAKHGFHIRKLNQAYFAFHGTYADNPGSISPIYDQLQELRQASHSLGRFVQLMAGVSNHDDFKVLLEET